MSLNIEGASIGFDANNIEDALSNLNTQVIEQTIDKMNSDMSNLRDYVDSAWVGSSAEQFKTNMETDKRKIIQGLRDTYDALRSEMYQIANEMSNADEELIKGRSE